MDIKLLRARARKVGITIQSARGTAYGFYYLNRPATQKERQDWGETRSYLETLAGLQNVEAYLAAVEAVLAERNLSPSGEALIEIRGIVRERTAPPPVPDDPACSFCGEPKDDGLAYKVGAEEAGNWTHERCIEPFRERTRRQIEQMRNNRSYLL